MESGKAGDKGSQKNYNSNDKMNRDLFFRDTEFFFFYYLGCEPFW